MKDSHWERLLQQERDFVASNLEKLAWSRGDLAASADISPTTVSRFLAGITRSPHHRTVINMFQSLGWRYLRTLPMPTRGKKKKEAMAY